MEGVGFGRRALFLQPKVADWAHRRSPKCASVGLQSLSLTSGPAIVRGLFLRYAQAMHLHATIEEFAARGSSALCGRYIADGGSAKQLRGGEAAYKGT
jgi:hypothetical protein